METPIQLSFPSKGRSLFKQTSQLAWGLFIYLLLVIAWGAYVRASGSGAGCGSHWPLCNGQILPLNPSLKTIIEFTHRITSGLSLLFCVLVFWSAFRNYPSRSFTRKGATATLVMIFIEALLGAGLVLFELVAENKSVFRTFSLGVHLLSTFLLLGAVVCTAHWAQLEIKERLSIRPLQGNFLLAFFSLLSIFGLFLLGGSGAMTALGDTLFPSPSVHEGLSQDLSPTSHFLIQLRVFHPLLAIGITFFILIFSFYLKKRFENKNSDISFFSTLLAGFQLAQIFLGALNILLLVPTSLQLAHLLFADFIWVFLILTLSSIWVIPAQSRFKTGP